MSGLTRSQATDAPWDIQVPYLEAGFDEAARLMDPKNVPEYYKGKTLAGFTAPEKRAQKAIMRYAGGPAVKRMQDASANQLLGTYNLSNQLAQQATGYGSAAAKDAQARANAVGGYGGGLMDYGQGATRYGLSQGQYAGMTPFQESQMAEMLAGDVDTSSLRNVVGAMGRDVMGELQGTILPGIRTQMMGYQPGGGSRGNLVQSQAVQGATQRMVDNASKMYADAYSQAQNRRLQAGQLALNAQLAAQQLGTQGAQLGLGAGGLAQQGYGTGLQGVQGAQGAGQLGLSALSQYPTTMQAPLSMYGAVADVGSQRRAMNQERINQAMAKYNYQQQAPQQALQNYMSMISGNYGGTSTSTPSPLSSMGQLASLFMGMS